VLRMSLDAGNARDQLASLRIVRRMLSREGTRPIDAAIEAGLVPALVRYLIWQQPNPQLQLEALWALTNIASGTSAHTAVVVAAGALPLCVELLDSHDEAMREQAVWAICNIAGDSPACRDAVLATPALAKMVPQLGLHSTLGFVRRVVWVISNCLRGKVRVREGRGAARLLPLLLAAHTDPLPLHPHSPLNHVAPPAAACGGAAAANTGAAAVQPGHADAGELTVGAVLHHGRRREGRRRRAAAGR